MGISGLPWAFLGFLRLPLGLPRLPWAFLSILGLFLGLPSHLDLRIANVCEINSKPVAHANEIKYAMGGWGGNARSLRAVGVILTTPSARSLRETPNPRPQAPGCKPRAP